MKNEEPPQPGTSGAIWLRFVAAFVLLFLFWFSISAIISLQLRTAIDQWPFQLYAAWIAAYGCWFILKKWFASDGRLPGWLPISLVIVGSLLVSVVSARWGVDLVVLTSSILITALACRRLHKFLVRKQLIAATVLAKNLIGVVLVVGLFWVTSSIVNISQTLPTTQGRSTQTPNGVRVGIALSGGGYRAALMHAGVLDMLEQLNVSPTNLTTVSGGSIVGAFYALGGTPRDFGRAVSSSRLDLVRELVFSSYLLRLPFGTYVPGTDVALAPQSLGLTRTDLQARVLDKVLFDSRRFSALAERGSFRQNVAIAVAATDLITGGLVGMLPDGILFVPSLARMDRDANGSLDVSRQPEFSPASVSDFPSREPISRVVAASGAFPIAFEPLRARKQDGSLWMLADGGLTDNSGLVLFSALQRTRPRSPLIASAWDVDLIISSDASAIFQTMYKDSVGPDEQLGRAVDIMYTAVGRGYPYQIVTPVVYLSPSHNRARMPVSRNLAEEAQALSKAEALLRSALLESKNTSLRRVALRADTGPYWFELALNGDSPNFGVLAKDLVDCANEFLATPTLRATFASQDASKLFRLGQYLVLLNYESIVVSLQLRGKNLH